MGDVVGIFVAIDVAIGVSVVGLALVIPTVGVVVLTVLVPMVEMGVVGLTVVSIVDVTVNS